MQLVGEIFCCLSHAVEEAVGAEPRRITIVHVERLYESGESVDELEKLDRIPVRRTETKIESGVEYGLFLCWIGKTVR